MYEHRYVWWLNTGDLAEGYVIHHINENKHDNRIENLQKITVSEHTKMHHSK